MCQARFSVTFAVALLLAACSQADDELADEHVASGQPSAPPVPGNVASSPPINRASLGQVHYAYDPEDLTRAEIELPLPPDFKRSVFAIKLIPAEYADNIGAVGCSYGATESRGRCTAQEELGVELALLERPLADYRGPLEERGALAERIETVSLDGNDGFAFALTLGQSSRRYMFISIGSRTLLVARRTAPGFDTGSEALKAALASIDVRDVLGRRS